MRKKKKINILLSIVLIFIILIPLIVYAASSIPKATVELETSIPTVKRGKEFSVSLNVNCADGINGIMGKINHDSDLELQGIETANSSKWTVISENTNTELNILCNSTNHETTGDVCKIKFKVKDTATLGSKTISLVDLHVDSDAEKNSLIDLDNEMISIKVEDTTPIEPGEKANVTLESTPAEVLIGQEFFVGLNVTCADGINGVMGKVTFDDELEFLGIEVVDTSKWISMLSNENTEINILCSSTSHETAGEVCRIKFKVKDTAIVGDKIVSVTNLQVDSDAESNSLINIGTKSVIVKVQTSSPTNPPVNPPSVSPSSSPEHDKTGKLEGNFPKTGVSSYVLFSVVLVVSITISYIGYKKYEMI